MKIDKVAYGASDDVKFTFIIDPQVADTTTTMMIQKTQREPPLPKAGNALNVP